MMTSADKVGGWVKKVQNHDDVILEWSLTLIQIDPDCSSNLSAKPRKTDSICLTSNYFLNLISLTHLLEMCQIIGALSV